MKLFYKSYSNDGFTLIEIVVVIVIILIIGGVSAPGIINYQESQNRERFINQLENEIKSAQIDAMTKDIIVRVSYTASTKTISFCQGTNYSNCINLVHPPSITGFRILNGTASINQFFIDSLGNTKLTANTTTQTALKFEIKVGSITTNVNLNEYGGSTR